MTKNERLVEYVNHMTGVDLKPFIETRFSHRKYINVYWQDMKPEDWNQVLHLQYYGGIKHYDIEKNGNKIVLIKWMEEI